MIELIVSIEEALKIADTEARRLIEKSPRLSSYTDFSSLRLKDESSEFWTFVSGSNQWYEDGGVPAAIYISVDKRDGHIWSREELEQFYMKVRGKINVFE
jgi:hypothetical protein